MQSIFNNDKKMDNNHSIWQLNLNEFNAAIASASPTPGGGSVSVVCGEFGLSLIIMAVEITKKTRPVPELSLALEKAQLLSNALKGDADFDILVFNKYMDAMKMPKNTEGEKENRKEAIQSASEEATISPLAAAKRMFTCIELANGIKTYIKKEVISDIGAGVYILNGAINSTLLNVDINIPNIKNYNLADKIKKEKEILIVNAARLTQEIGQYISVILTPNGISQSN